MPYIKVLYFSSLEVEKLKEFSLIKIFTPLTPPPLHHTTPMGKLSPELDVMGTWGWRRRHWRLRMGQW